MLHFSAPKAMKETLVRFAVDSFRIDKMLLKKDKCIINLIRKNAIGNYKSAFVGSNLVMRTVLHKFAIKVRFNSLVKISLFNVIQFSDLIKMSHHFWVELV
jgi:hypothetical protein